MNLNIRLDEYCESVRDGTHDTPKPTPEGFHLVTSKAIKNNKIDFDSCYFISEEDYIKINKRSKVDKWDVLMTMIGTVGRLLLVKDNPNYAIKNIALFKVNDEYKAKWLYYYLSTKNVQDYFEMIASGTSQHFIGLGHLRKLKINDYHAGSKQIIDILSTYDELIENNNKRIKLLEQMAEHLYKEWFVRFRFPGYENAEFDNGIPKGWEIYQAQNLFDITIGRTPDRKQFDYFTTNKDDALWVSISDMKDNMFVTKSSEYLTDEAIKKVNMPMVEEDTVLLSFKLSVGRVSITTKQSCTNEAIAHFKTNDKELLEYTYLYLKLFNYQNLGNTSAIGNAVNSTIIKKMKFLLPNRELIQEFHNCTKDIFAQIKNIMNENDNLIKQRDLLLPRLMSGKLEV